MSVSSFFSLNSEREAFWLRNFKIAETNVPTIDKANIVLVSDVHGNFLYTKKFALLVEHFANPEKCSILFEGKKINLPMSTVWCNPENEFGNWDSDEAIQHITLLGKKWARAITLMETIDLSTNSMPEIKSKVTKIIQVLKPENISSCLETLNAHRQNKDIINQNLNNPEQEQLQYEEKLFTSYESTVSKSLKNIEENSDPMTQRRAYFTFVCSIIYHRTINSVEFRAFMIQRQKMMIQSIDKSHTSEKIHIHYFPYELSIYCSIFIFIYALQVIVLENTLVPPKA